MTRVGSDGLESREEDTNERARELRLISRLLNDDAASKWYLAAFVQVAASVDALVSGLVGVDGLFGGAVAAVAVLLLVCALILRQAAESKLAAAEGLRRYAAVAEGLGESVPDHRYRLFAMVAGARRVRRARDAPRGPHYYDGPGPSPERLIAMTRQAAYWRLGYSVKLQRYVMGCTVIVGIIWVALVVLVLSRSFSETWEVRISQAVLAVLPLFLTFQFLEWLFRLGRTINALHALESEIASIGSATLLDALRLTGEFDCAVSAGVPIHRALHGRWNSEIDELWRVTSGFVESPEHRSTTSTVPTE